MSIHFDGACPFLTCHDVKPHEHPVCETCEAANYSNIGCPTCRANHVVPCPGCRGKGTTSVTDWRCCGNFAECCENAVRWSEDYPCQHCDGAGFITPAAYRELVGEEA